MQDNGEVKLFKLSTESEEEEYMIVFTEDYRSHVQCAMTEINIPKEVTGKNFTCAYMYLFIITVNSNLDQGPLQSSR